MEQETEGAGVEAGASSTILQFQHYIRVVASYDRLGVICQRD